MLFRAGRPADIVSKPKRFQLFEVVVEPQLKQPERAAIADPSGAESELQLRERERERERELALK